MPFPFTVKSWSEVRIRQLLCALESGAGKFSGVLQKQTLRCQLGWERRRLSLTVTKLGVNSRAADLRLLAAVGGNVFRVK